MLVMACVHVLTLGVMLYTTVPFAIPNRHGTPKDEHRRLYTGLYIWNIFTEQKNLKLVKKY